MRYKGILLQSVYWDYLGNDYGNCFCGLRDSTPLIKRGQMKFCFNEEQVLFAETVREMLTKQCSPDHIDEFISSESGTLAPLWDSFTSIGIPGMAAPSSFGGLEMSDLDFVLIMEELGRAACPEPVMEHAVLSVPLLAECNTENTYNSILKSVITGNKRVSVALDGQYILGADSANYLLLFQSGALHLVEPESVELQRQPSVDETRHLFSIEWNPTMDTVIEEDPDRVSLLALKTELRAEVATSAQCVGVAERLLEKTVQYVQERNQFGKPVGANQAIKHHLADTGKAIEFARPMVYRAAWCLSNGDPETDLAVHMGKLLASRAVELACQTSLQCHGAIAYTSEYDLQIWLKRGLTLSSSWGDIYGQREKIANCLGL